MKNSAFHILRVGVAITFLWIGILILREPGAWAGYLEPWAANLVPGSLEQAMIGTAILDILIGFLLLIDVLTWVAAAVGALHLIIVLVTSGINAITVRDIGLFAGALALSIQSWPTKYYFWEKLRKN
jgi:uncharacterized membrane protein YphA (DoxX/SURF4 family)